jgi:hypothetical protein
MARRVHAAERRAHAALIRSGFDDPAIAIDVLRQVQVLTRTAHLALLDYTTAGPAQDAIANLIIAERPPAAASLALPPAVPGGLPGSVLPTASAPAAPSVPDQPLARPTSAQETQPAEDHEPAGDHDADQDGEIIAAAADIVAEALQRGERLSQKALGGKLRSDGYRVGNHSLRGLLAAASSHINASSLGDLGKEPGGLPDPRPLVNGSETVLASRLPGHEPGTGPVDPLGA